MCVVALWPDTVLSFLYERAHRVRLGVRPTEFFYPLLRPCVNITFPGHFWSLCVAVAMSVVPVVAPTQATHI